MLLVIGIDRGRYPLLFFFLSCRIRARECTFLLLKKNNYKKNKKVEQKVARLSTLFLIV